MSDVVLAVEGLVKRFGTLVAVDRLSFEVREGEVFGFLGPNGAGKTTTISILCGLLAADQGRVLLQGLALDGRARTRVGLCPQSIVVWERLTCLEQLEFMGSMYDMGRAEARRRGSALLGELGLEDKADALAGTLSGGMKRRLNLALALVHDPALVVLDEPEAGLDPQSRVTVRDFVRGLARRKTVVLTTHNMDEAERVADRVAIIDHGRLLVLDTPEALKHDSPAGDVLELQCVPPGAGTPEVVRAALAPVAGLDDVQVHEGLLSLRVRDGAARLAEVIAALAAAGLRATDLRLRTTTLEDVFLRLTGRGLRE